MDVTPEQITSRMRLLLTLSLLLSLVFLLMAITGPQVGHTWFWLLFGLFLVTATVALVLTLTEAKLERLSRELPQGTSEGAVVHLLRSREQWRDKGRRYKVIVDGCLVGAIANGESKDFGLLPGQHLVRIGVDWTGSKQISIDLHDGESKTLYCCPKGSAYSLPYRALSRHAWIDLHDPSIAFD